MARLTFKKIEEVSGALLSKKEKQLARQSGQLLLLLLSNKKNTGLDVVVKDAHDNSNSIHVPFAAGKLFATMLEKMAEGNDMLLIPMDTELTTQEAADILNVSRPYLIRLLDKKYISYSKVGTRRKIKSQDVLAYKAKTDAASRKAFDELTQEAQELGLY
jgi:excisionase family DNA binding protein